MAGVTTAWAISHFFGVGEMADAVLLVAGGVVLGASAFQVGHETMVFALTVHRAKTTAELDAAAQHFAEAVVLGGITVVRPCSSKRSPSHSRRCTSEGRSSYPIASTSNSSGGISWRPGGMREDTRQRGAEIKGVALGPILVPGRAMMVFFRSDRPPTSTDALLAASIRGWPRARAHAYVKGRGALDCSNVVGAGRLLGSGDRRLFEPAGRRQDRLVGGDECSESWISRPGADR
jgi:hypothetical protein